MAEGKTQENVIVVGIDGSEASLCALRWAVAQTKLTKSTLEMIATWEYPTSLGWAPAYPSDWDPAGDTKKALAKIVDDEIGANPGFDVRQVVVEGHAAPVLVQASAKAELLVVGSRGHGEFAGMLIGSVSEYCAMHAQCPVVIVRQENKES